MALVDGVWSDSTRSLNIDSTFTYERDGNSWIAGWKSRQQMTPKAPNSDLTFCASTMHTNTTGRSTDADSNCDEVSVHSSDTSGSEEYALYGPYMTDLSAGQWYQADFRIKIDSYTGGAIDRVLLLDSFVYPKGTIAHEIVKGSEVTEGVYQNYSLKFQNPDSDMREFRVRVYNNADVTFDTVTLREAPPPPVTTKFTYESEDMPSAVPSSNVIDAAASEQAARASASIGHMVYGPYTTEQGVGDYKATFYIKNSGNGTGFLAAIDAYNSNGLASKSLSFKIVQGSELTSTGYTPIIVNFTRTDTDGTMEYRVKNIGGTELTVDRIVVEQV
jgi:hypothetical protein